MEKALQKKAAKDGVTGKTLSNIAGSLHGFVAWCLKRKYLADPLDGLREFDTSVTPENFRRAFTQEEIGRLLTATPEPRRFLYRVALVTGFRASEIKALRVGDLDRTKKTIRLCAERAKDRREAVCALPDDLVLALVRHVGKHPDEATIFPFFNPNDAANRIT